MVKLKVLICGNMQRVDRVSRKLGIPTYTYVTKTEYTICNNIPWNVEAVMNPCVDNVNFTITGPNNYKYSRFVYVKLMCIFDFFTFGLTSGGNNMNVGTYWIEAIPDRFAYKERNLTLTVISC
jgi:hypothetical protein